MKNISKIIAIVGIALGTTSCSDDFNELNIDPKHPTTLASRNQFSTSLNYSFKYIYTPSVNYNNFRFFTQQIAETQYIDETNYNLINRNQPRNNFQVMYIRCLNTIKLAKQSLVSEPNKPEVKANKEASLEIHEIFLWETLVDTYGDIPYFDSLDPKVKVSPKYDDAFTIYTDLIKRINTVISKINTSAPGYNTSDFVYNGNMEHWKRFANSIKLRLAINLSDVNPALAKKTAEEAIASGVINSEPGSYKMSFDGATFSNPVYDNFIASQRNDFVPTELVINLMNKKSDPRRSVWFTDVNGEFVGGTFGTINNYFKKSHYTSFLTDATAPVKLLSHTEVKFLLAEAAARGYNAGGNAADLYKEGIKASMLESGVKQSDIDKYIAANPYDASNWKKSIGEEAYIALFDRGFATWNFTRRLDFPKLVNPKSSKLATIPHRMPYSNAEYQMNKVNVLQAAAKIGEDKAETKLFWDIK